MWRYACSDHRRVREIGILFHGLSIHSPGVTRISAVAVASEIAGIRPDVQGPGTFLPAFIDELSKLTPEILSEKVNIEIAS